MCFVFFIELYFCRNPRYSDIFYIRTDKLKQRLMQDNCSLSITETFEDNAFLYLEKQEARKLAKKMPNIENDAIDH